MSIVRRLSFALILITAAGITPAFAQSERETSILAGAGVMNYDLSGTGTKPAFTGRVSHELGANFVLEGSVLFAKPEQQFGPSTLIVPEVQLQYHWPVGRFTPYLGAGLGVARHSADDLETDWSPAISVAGGSRVSLNDRVGLFGELRLRGIEWDFAGSTTDIMGGIVVKVGR
jgi:outer membrane protein W